MRQRSIPGFPGYRVIEDGTIESRHRSGTRALGPWRSLRTSVDAKGYAGLTICSTMTGQRKKVRVHRLVAELFIANPGALPCVRHLNGDPADNRVANLAWGPYRDNEEDKRAHGTYDLRRAGKLSVQAAADIRTRYAAGQRQADLAAEYGVSRPTITRIVNGSTWR